MSVSHRIFTSKKIYKINSEKIMYGTVFSLKTWGRSLVNIEKRLFPSLQESPAYITG